MHLFLLSFFLIAVSLQAKPTRFEIKDGNHRNQIDFVMEGPLERTVGLSHFVSGWIEVDPEAVSEGIKGELETDTRTFDTGAEQKNLYIREKILEAGQFPSAKATFIKMKSITQGRFIEGETLTAKVDTQIQLKGVTKNLIVPLKLVYYKEGELSKQRLPGNLLKLSTNIEFDPSLWGILLPDPIKALSGKIMQLNVFVAASDHLTPAVSIVPEGIKPK